MEIREIYPTALGNVLSGTSDYVSVAVFHVLHMTLSHRWTVIEGRPGLLHGCRATKNDPVLGS